MKKVKKVVYNVQCAYNPEHIFEKVFEIQEGSEKIDSELEAYCPYCDKFVSIEIQGKPPPDELLRKFNIE
jgi:aspartate carbamoyltransferase regulatory subunit